MGMFNTRKRLFQARIRVSDIKAGPVLLTDPTDYLIPEQGTDRGLLDDLAMFSQALKPSTAGLSDGQLRPNPTHVSITAPNSLPNPLKYICLNPLHRSFTGLHSPTVRAPERTRADKATSHLTH